MRSKFVICSIFAVTILIFLAVGVFKISQDADEWINRTADNSVYTSKQPAADEQSAVDRGRYIATAANCIACHTAPNSEDKFAGGNAIDTPFGRIFSTNITPDEQTGIGTWTEQDFFMAVRSGKRKDGQHLYPAMPYTSYVKITDDDLHDLWMYFRSIPPIVFEPPETKLPFPFNIRLALFAWNLLNFDREIFVPDDERSASWNRGAYLVQGLSHCAVCHTAKNMIGGDEKAYLQGGNIGRWYAPDITGNIHAGIGSWSKEDLAEYLKTGSNATGVASGPMAEVISNSTQYLTNDDVASLAEYIKSLPGDKEPAPPRLEKDDAAMIMGVETYKQYCSVCHRPDGMGYAGRAARLAGSPNVQSTDPTSLITTILNGSKGVSTEYKRTAGVMPKFAEKVSDDKLAAVLTYIRNNWGNSGAVVGASDVKRVRDMGPSR